MIQARSRSGWSGAATSARISANLCTHLGCLVGAVFSHINRGDGNNASGFGVVFQRVGFRGATFGAPMINPANFWNAIRKVSESVSDE